jgi:hypothetical protein
MCFHPFEQFDDGSVEATDTSSKSLSGDGSETSYKIGDDYENSSNEELHPCPKKKSPSKAKKVAITSKPSSRTTLKSNSKTTAKSSSLNSEKQAPQLMWHLKPIMTMDKNY